jgi:hypothetical protein
MAPITMTALSTITARPSATALTGASTRLPLPRHINSRAQLLGKPRG